MSQLRMSDVIFDEKNHEYHLNGHALKGVTPIVKWMFPDTYLAIPDDVLRKAADYGHLIHSKIELYDQTGIRDDECQPLTDYIGLMERYGMKAYLNEYLVDDGQNIASSIDVVFGKNMAGEWPLGDIKTTSQIHVNNVRLQLSIYAWLFELDNPGEKAGELFVIWLPKPQYGEPRLMELDRIEPDVCERIVKAYLEGEDSGQFDDLWNIGKVRNEDVVEDVPVELGEMMLELRDILEKEKEIAERKDELKKFLLKQMQESGVKTWKADGLTISKVSASVRQTVDSKKLKSDYPEIYAQVSKVQKISETIQVKLK